MVTNNFSINLAKIRIKTEYGCITIKPPKSVSDRGNPFHVACVLNGWEWVQSVRLALPISNCAIGETVCYFAKINKHSSPNW